MTFLFLPVVPLGEWTMERAEGSDASWQVAGVARPRLVESLAWVAAGILAVVAALLPAYLAIALFMGSRPVELGGLFASAGAIVGALGWLDQTRDRVPSGAAARVMAARPATEEGP
jgi:hypothetical protein